MALTCLWGLQPESSSVRARLSEYECHFHPHRRLAAFLSGRRRILRFHERVAVVVGRRNFGGSRLEIKAALASEAITWFVVLSGESGGWFKSFLILVFLTETQVKNECSSPTT